MTQEEWSEEVGTELDDLCSGANHVLQTMLQDGTWEGMQPSEAVRMVLLYMLTDTADTSGEEQL